MTYKTDLESITATFYHDAQTPLLTIEKSVEAFEELLPLIASYIESNPEVGPIKEMKVGSADTPEMILDHCKSENEYLRKLISNHWDTIKALAKQPNQASPHDIKNRRALVVEPNGVNMLLLVSFFKTMGVDLVYLPDFEGLNTAFEAQTIDCVFINLDLLLEQPNNDAIFDYCQAHNASTFALIDSDACKHNTVDVSVLSRFNAVLSHPVKKERLEELIA